MAPVFNLSILFVKIPNVGSESSWLLSLVNKLTKICMAHLLMDYPQENCDLDNILRTPV